MIDSHGSATASEVWELLNYTLKHTGAKPLLVEWDNDVPNWNILRDEANLAATALAQAVQS